MIDATLINITEEQLKQLANTLGEMAKGNEIFLLSGDLGAGKTVFAKALAKGFGVDKHVTSPTFTLINIYDTARGKFLHLDLYRIEDPEEVAYLGIEEYFEEAVLAIEWPERLPELPDHYLAIKIESIDPQLRNIAFTAQGQSEEGLLEEMNKIANISD